MKKLYILTTITFFTFALNAQDLRVTWDSYTDGQVITGASGGETGASPVNLNVTITNDGTNTLQVGDTILFAFQVQSDLLSFGNLSVGDVSTPGLFALIIANQPFAPGGTLAISNGAVNPPLGAITPIFPAGTPVGTQRRICAIAYEAGTAVPFDTTFANDLTPANNRSCVFYELDTPVGIEENLTEIADNIYVSNDDLIINNSSFDFNSQATVNIINLTGQIVKSEELVIQRGVNTINLTGLAEGTYVVSVQVEDETITKKIMIQ